MTAEFNKKILFSQKKGKNGPKMTKNKDFLSFSKIFVITFLGFVVDGEKWDLQLGWVKNSLGQSDCRILKTTISQERWGQSD